MRHDALRILVVDDHALVRYGVTRLLRDEPDIEDIGEADTADLALKRIREESWDAVVMDINMPGKSAFDALRLIKQEKPELPVLILTMHAEEVYAMRALRDGASGYLTKASAPDHLVTAIRKVVDGGAYVSANLALQLATQLRSKTIDNLHELLSDREINVLCDIASGKPLSQIADELHLSAKTITTYRRRVLDKLQVHSNAELARYAIEHGLIH
ncbi:MAG: response regulator transcription factor [Burkholderiales bacterium]